MERREGLAHSDLRLAGAEPPEAGCQEQRGVSVDPSPDLKAESMSLVREREQDSLLPFPRAFPLGNVGWEVLPLFL